MADGIPMGVLLQALAALHAARGDRLSAGTYGLVISAETALQQHLSNLPAVRVAVPAQLEAEVTL